MEEMMNTVSDGFTTARTFVDGGLATARSAMDSGFNTARGAALTGFNTAKGAFDTGLTTAKGNVFNFFNGDRITTRKKLITFGAIVFMLGIILGFVFSPVKKGFYFNISNNGNGKPEDDDEE